MQLTSILRTRAAYWANLQVMTSFDSNERDFGVYYYLQLADTVQYILNDIFICIIKEQCSDQWESERKCLKGCKNNVNDGLHQINWLNIGDTPMAKSASMECQQF